MKKALGSFLKDLRVTLSKPKSITQADFFRMIFCPFESDSTQMKDAAISKIINQTQNAPTYTDKTKSQKQSSAFANHFKNTIIPLLDNAKLSKLTSDYKNSIATNLTIISDKKDIDSLLDMEDITDFITNLILIFLKYPNNVKNNDSEFNTNSFVQSGVVCAYSQSREIPMDEYLKSATREIDILHIRGRSWLKPPRALVLSEKMENPNITFKFYVLLPTGLFFSPYAKLIHKTPADFYEGTKEALNYIDNLYQSATNGRKKKGCKLYVYLCDYFPSVNIVRIDDLLFLNYRSLTGALIQSWPALKCIDPKNVDHSYYESSMTAFKELETSCAVCIDASKEEVKMPDWIDRDFKKMQIINEAHDKGIFN